MPLTDDGRPLFDQDSKVHYLTDATGNANGAYVISGSDGNFYDISISSTGEVSFKPKDAPPTLNLKVVPMKRVTHALGQVDSLRGELGAMQHRLNRSSPTSTTPPISSTKHAAASRTRTTPSKPPT
ncbi:hypothetical protein WJ972_10890 [Achromobacter insuavis]